MIYNDLRDAAFEEIYLKALKDKDIIVLIGDQGAGTFKKFRDNIPNQLINCGPSEQNLIGVAAGLAVNGKKVFVHGITPFITLRCFEQISLDLGLDDLPVTIIGNGAGYSYSHEGPTHHSIQDIGLMKMIPKMNVYHVSDTICLSKIILNIIDNPTLNYIVFDHDKLEPIYNENHEFEDGLSKLKDGKEMIIASGYMVHKALKISEILKTGVIDIYRIKPLNEGLLIKYLKNVKKVIVIEEHLEYGGLASTISDFITDNHLKIKFKRFGVKNLIRYYGKREYIAKQIGLDIETIINGIKS